MVERRIFDLDADVDLLPSVCAGTFAIRTDGLLGDSIVASSAFEWITSQRPGQSAVIYSTYGRDPTRLALLADLFQELFEDRWIRAIVHKGRAHGPVSRNEEIQLRALGCEQCYDCGPFEQSFAKMSRGAPYLGARLRQAWDDRAGSTRRVALFRCSRFHDHYPLRNRPWDEWKWIEEQVIELGLKPCIFGWDDYMPTLKESHDYRRRLSVYQTLQEMANCRFLISTVTFAPLFCQHYCACLVISDPRDIENLRLRWKVRSEYKIFDASLPYRDELREQILLHTS